MERLEAPLAFGVAAMMFKKSGTNEKVLVFRGSRTEGDFLNAAALIMGNILFDQDGAGMQEILESNWEKVGLGGLTLSIAEGRLSRCSIRSSSELDFC